MEISFIVFAWGVGFALTSCFGLILGSSKLRWLQRTPTGVLGVGAAVGAALAVAATARPTGIGLLDVLMRAAFAALFAAAVARARRRIRLVVALVLAIPMVLAALDVIAGATDRVPLSVAVATAGAAAASYLFPERVAWIGSIIGVGASFAALRMPVGMVSLVPSALAAAVLFFACASAWVTLKAPARKRFRRGAIAMCGLAFIAGAAGVVALVNARASAERGLDDARAGLAAASSGDATAANAAFTSASSALRTASSQLDGKYARIGRSLPVLSQHISVLRDLTSTASTVTETASIAAGQADLEQLRVSGGRINLEKLKTLSTQIDSADTAITQARGALARSRSPWIVSPLRARIDHLGDQIADAETASAQVKEILTVIPPMFGADGPRRYMLVLPSPAELRSSGGVMGNWGELTAINGTLSLSRFGRTADLYTGGVPYDQRVVEAPAEYMARYASFGAPKLWSNVSVSPDFPTVAKVYANQFVQAFDQPSDVAANVPVDGVISVDPVALQALLGVLGPLDVQGWDEPLTGTNTASVLMHDAYVVKGGVSPERLELLADVTLGVWQKLTSVALPSPKVLAEAVGPVAKQRHLQVWMRNSAEQAYIERIGIAGAIPTLTSDSLGVFFNNGGENKIDSFLYRSTTVDVKLDRKTGTVDSTVTLDLRNDAPASGEPAYILGAGTLTPVGSLRYYITVYSPLPLVRAQSTIDGQPLTIYPSTELGRNAYSFWITVGSKQSSRIVVRLKGDNPLGSDGYRLDVLRQAMVNADPLTVNVASVGGSADRSSLSAVTGFSEPGGPTLRYEGEPSAEKRFEAAFR